MAVDAAVSRRLKLASRARAVPIWAWLSAIVAASALIRFVIGRGTVAPWIMVDELIYSELAKSFADSGSFLVRDQPTAAYGIVYPVLIAPAWAIFEAVPQAYAAAKAINAVVMSLAAIPAYFLARRVLSPGLSLAAAALTVAVPSMVYTATLMTENAFYPIFLVAALAMVLWLEEPTVQRTAALLAVCGIAYLTRAQALALFPALLTAPVLVAGRHALRRYAVVYGAAAAAAIVAVVVQAARGASPLGLLGAYEVAGRADYSFGEIVKWFLYHVAELDLALAVIPFAALLLLGLRFRALEARDRIFIAATISLSFWLVLEVATFASEQAFRIEERNMFYVVPLFLIALLVWIERGLARPQPATAAAAGVAVALPLVIPYDDFIGLNAVSDTPALLPLGWLVEHGLALDHVDLVVIVGSIVAGLAFVLMPRRWALVLPAMVLVYFAVSQHPIVAEQRFRSSEHLFGGITNEHRDWIDRGLSTLGTASSSVSVLWTGHSDKFTVWENEIFNRSVGPVYTTGPAVPGGLAQTPLTLDRESRFLRDPEGERVRATFLLTDATVELDGDLLLEDERKGMLVYVVAGFVRQIAFVSGLYPRDTWSGKNVTYVRRECRGGTLSVDLQSDGTLFAEPNAVVARVGGRVVARTLVQPTEPTKLRVPLQRDGNSCTVRFTVARTAVPNVVTGGANPDARPLGLHFNLFTYVRP